MLNTAKSTGFHVNFENKSKNIPYSNISENTSLRSDVSTAQTDGCAINKQRARKSHFQLAQTFRLLPFIRRFKKAVLYEASVLLLRAIMVR
jgi:hypothetical protein